MLGSRCRFTKGYHKNKQGDYNNEFRSAMHHTTTQHQSTSCSDSRRLFELHRDDTSHSNLPSLEIGALEVECPAEIPTPTRLNTILFPKVNRGEISGVSKDPMKRRRKIHHVPPIYIHYERLVRCFNQLY